MCMDRREGMLRSGGVAGLLGVGGHTVARWVKGGGVRAVSPKRKTQDPGSEVKNTGWGSGRD